MTPIAQMVRHVLGLSSAGMIHVAVLAVLVVLVNIVTVIFSVVKIVMMSVRSLKQDAPKA